MITFNYETKFVSLNEALLKNWIAECISDYDFKEGDLNFIFCDDAYLHKLNVEFLNHDTLTDIISFDYTLGTLVSGDIFISIERVKENATTFDTSFNNELHRVMIHGILHYMGLKDKTEEEKQTMRTKENQCLSVLNT